MQQCVRRGNWWRTKCPREAVIFFHHIVSCRVHVDASPCFYDCSHQSFSHFSEGKPRWSDQMVIGAAEPRRGEGGGATVTNWEEISFTGGVTVQRQERNLNNHEGEGSILWEEEADELWDLGEFYNSEKRVIDERGSRNGGQRGSWGGFWCLCRTAALKAMCLRQAGWSANTVTSRKGEACVALSSAANEMVSITQRTT